MHHVEANGLHFSYEDVGASSDVLVLVHGHPFDCSMWRPQLDAFGGQDWRVIAPDLRGYGASSVVPGKTTLATFAVDLITLLDQLQIDGVVIGGLSMGGQVVMEFCRLFPDRVRGVILAATFPQSETAEGKLARSAMADRLMREGMRPYADEVLPSMLASTSIVAMPKVAEHVLRMMRNASPGGAAAALRGRAERPSYEDVLADLDVPALIIVGDEDAFTSKSDADRMQALLKRAKQVCIRGAGHMPNLERPAQFNAAVAEFLDEIAPRRPAVNKAAAIS